MAGIPDYPTILKSVETKPFGFLQESRFANTTVSAAARGTVLVVKRAAGRGQQFRPQFSNDLPAYRVSCQPGSSDPCTGIENSHIIRIYWLRIDRFVFLVAS
jgi:hypothetical protein